MLPLLLLDAFSPPTLSLEFKAPMGLGFTFLILEICNVMLLVLLIGIIASVFVLCH